MISLFTHRFRWVFTLILGQLLLTIVLVFWWGYLLLEKGTSHLVTTPMVVSEGLWFIVVLAAASFFLVGLLVRDNKRVRDLQAFFASLSHELKTPLTSMRLQAESLSEMNLQPPGAHTLMRRLLQDSFKLETQVERSLELARIEGGGNYLTQPLMIGPIIEATVSNFCEIEPHKIKFILKHKNSLVNIDPYTVQIVLKNLFENTIRHSQKSQSTITIESTVVSSQQYVLLIRDDGVGSPNKDLGKLFAKGKNSHGAGVGLYLVKALMKAMQGGAKFQGDNGFVATLTFIRSIEDFTSEEKR